MFLLLYPILMILFFPVVWTLFFLKTRERKRSWIPVAVMAGLQSLAVIFVNNYPGLFVPPGERMGFSMTVDLGIGAVGGIVYLVYTEMTRPSAES